MIRKLLLSTFNFLFGSAACHKQELSTIICLLSLIATASYAQAPRSSFGMEGFNYGHEINPAIQPDSSYWSLPLLGNTSISLSSSMKMKDLLFDTADGKITTFMNSGTISKSDLMDRVGNGLKGGFDMRWTLASFGRRLSPSRYQTLAVTWRTQGDIFMDKGLFDVMKEVENRPYSIGKSTIDVSSFMEVALGESRRLDDHWTIGLKAKVLFGIINANAEVEDMNIDLSTGKWIAQGHVNANVSGLEYKTTTKEYKGQQGTYTMVNSAKLATPGLHGLGIAVDAGATYKLDNRWTFSAAVLDLGFISWFKSHKAVNSGKEFVFDGFHEISTDKENPNSLSKQMDKLSDQLMDMAHLEEAGTGTNTRMLACTLNGGATYKYDETYSASLLLTERIYGKSSAFEGRLNLNAHSLIKNVDIALSPAVSTFGFQLGGMLRWHPGRYQIYIASDNFLNKLTKQLIPTSLNTSINFGMTL